MSLCGQRRKNYNVFSQDGKVGAPVLNIAIPDDTAITLLTMSDGDEAFHESELTKLDAEYTFLHDTLGWGEGLSESSDEHKEHCQSNIAKLAEYLFVTEHQMNWGTVLRCSVREVKRQLRRNCNKYMTWMGFSQNTGMSSPKRKGQRH